jgi:hypothetical protein
MTDKDSRFLLVFCGHETNTMSINMLEERSSLVRYLASDICMVPSLINYLVNKNFLANSAYKYKMNEKNRCESVQVIVA